MRVAGSDGRIGLLRRPHVTSSLLRNSSFLMLNTALTSALGYFYWVVAAHGYSARIVGLATALIAAQSLNALVCCFGVDALLIQELPRVEEDGAWSSLVTTAVVLGFSISAAVAAGVATLLSTFSANYTILRDPVDLLLFILGAGFGTAGGMIDATFIAGRQGNQVLFRNVVFCALKLPIMALPLLLTRGRSVSDILLSWALAMFISLVGSYVWQVRQIRPDFRPQFGGGLAHFVKLRGTVLSQFLTNVGSQLPQFMLPVIVVALVTPVANAYFYLSWTVGSIFLFVSPAVSLSLFVEGSHSEDISRTARKSLTFISALLLPLILGAVVLAHPVLRLFGPQYASHGTTLLRIIACSAIPDAVTNVYVSVARIQRQVRRAARLNVMMALLAVALTAVLVQFTSVAGPGWAWLIAQSTGAALVALPLFRVLRDGRGTLVVGGSVPATSEPLLPVAEEGLVGTPSSIPAPALLVTPGGARVEVISSHEGARALAAEWARFHDSIGSNNPFLHPGWLLTWARASLDDRDVCVVVVRESDQLIGIAPLAWCRIAPMIRTIQPMGYAPHGQFTEMPAVLVRPGHHRTVYRALVRDLQVMSPRWHWATLPVGGGQQWFEPQWISQSDGANGDFALHKASRAFVILDLPDSWADFLRARKRNVRESIRRAHNRLDAEGPWSVDSYAGGQAFERGLRVVIDLHRARSEMPRKPHHRTMFPGREAIEIYSSMTQSMAADGLAEVSILLLHGEPAAGLVVLRSGDTVFVSVTGSDPAAWQFSPGTVLIADLARREIARGTKHINLSGGPDQSKLRWSERLELSHDFALLGSGWAAHARYAAYAQVHTLRTMSWAREWNRAEDSAV